MYDKVTFRQPKILVPSALKLIPYSTKYHIFFQMALHLKGRQNWLLLIPYLFYEMSSERIANKELRAGDFFSWHAAPSGDFDIKTAEILC